MKSVDHVHMDDLLKPNVLGVSPRSIGERNYYTVFRRARSEIL